MYTDILDQVTGGSGGNTGRGGRSGRSGAGTRSSTTNSDDEIMVRFKAGRVTLEVYSGNSIETTPPPPLTNMGYSDTSSTDDETTTTTTDPETGISSTAVNQKENHQPKSTKYHCVARPERGEVRLVKTTTTTLLSTSSNPISYSWQWYSRSTDSVVETIPLLPSSTKMKHTFERVTLPNKKIYEQDRIYVWTQIPTISKKTKLLEVVDEIPEKPKYRMYWMQDADPTTDDTILNDVEKFFTEVATAAATTTTTSTATGTTTTTTSQVDALSSILENLGMPQQQQTNSTQDATATSTGMDLSASTTTSGSRNQLTLADLQGAMASIQQQQQQQSSMVGPPLQDIITVDSVDAILNNPDACQRLLQYLPAEQQSIEYLRDNLNSSSMQSTLRTLTQMLIPSQDADDNNNSNNNSNSNGSYTEYSNIIANFQLDPQDGEMALLQNNNPIEAFLNCIIASVEKEKDTDTNNNNNNEETTGEGNEDMEDENDDNNNNNNKKDDDDNDVQMNE